MGDIKIYIYIYIYIFPQVFFFMQTGSIKLRQWTNNRSGSKTNDSIVCIVKKIIGNSSHEKSIN